MSFLGIGKTKSPREQLRESTREVSHATRELDRELVRLQGEEKRLMAEIKKAAKAGNKTGAKSLARELVRMRDQMTKLQKTKTQMRGIVNQTHAMHATTTVAGAMKGATSAMVAMNTVVDPAKQRKTIMEFQKQSAHMDMTDEMLGDTLDDVLGGEDLEEESDDLTAQVLDEIGVDIATKLESVPRTSVKGKAPVQQADEEDDSDLERRLAALRS